MGLFPLSVTASTTATKPIGSPLYRGYTKVVPGVDRRSSFMGMGGPPGPGGPRVQLHHGL